ncbi:MAG: hypothetical protein EOP53_06050 [Sphingobacteriales bacterium]|nr:MAG: hypothetical protein EOP53_06050 [Sphingobacteriales bacterium]
MAQKTINYHVVADGRDISNKYKVKLYPTTIVVDNLVNGVSLEPTTAEFAHVPGKNNSKLHNRTIQLSIPVGFDYKILSGKKISWYVGTTLQPTYIADATSYLLSSDKSYLIEGHSMMRNWNLNGALESFVTFKTNSKTLINVGPQFRYQLMSSFNKRYIYTEKPYSVGLKVGITRPL